MTASDTAAGVTPYIAQLLENSDARGACCSGPPPAAPAAPVSGPELEAVTRAQLYQEARRLGVRGRSKMTKAQLKAALSGGGRT